MDRFIMPSSRRLSMRERPSPLPTKMSGRGISPDIPTSSRFHPSPSGDGCGEGERERRRMDCEHGGIPNAFKNVGNETSERGDFNYVKQLEREDEVKRLLEEIATLEKSPRNQPKKKNGPKDSKRKNKLRYPIDEYLNLTKKREEHFPLPSISPPPPSPSAKVMQRAGDLLEAAEYYLSSVRSDLSLGCQTPSEPSQGAEDSSSLCSSLSEEINPLLIKRAVNAAMGDVEAKVKNQIHSSAKSDLILSHERVRNVTSRSNIPIQGIISIPSNEDLDSMTQPLTVKSTSQSAKSNPAPDLAKTKQSVERAYKLAQEVNSNFIRMNALRKDLQRSKSSAVHTVKFNNLQNSPLISKKKSQMPSASSLDRVPSGAVAPWNTPNFSGEIINNGILKLIDGTTRKDKCSSQNSKKRPPSGQEPSNHNLKEDESVSSEIISEITTDSGTSPKLVSQIVKVNSMAKQRSADVGVNTSYSLLLDILNDFPEEKLHKDSICEEKSSRSVKLSTEKHMEDNTRRIPTCCEHNQTAEKPEDKRNNHITISSIDIPLPAKKQALPDLHSDVNSNRPPAITVVPLLENGEKKAAEKIIVDTSTDDEVPETANGDTVKEVPETCLKSSKKENSTVQTDFPTLAEVLENILINEVRKVAEEVQKSPSRQRENAEKLERSISEILDIETPPESAESSEEKILSIIQEQLTPLPSEEAIQKLIQMEEQVERICTPVASPTPGHLHVILSEQEYHLITVNTPSLSPLHLLKDESHEIEGNTFQEIETPCSTPVEVVSTPETSPKREVHLESPTPLQTPSPTPRNLDKISNADTVQSHELASVPSSKHVCTKDQATSYEEQSSYDQSHSATRETVPSDRQALIIPELKNLPSSDRIISTGTSRNTTSRNLETLREEVMKALRSVHSTTVPTLVSERSNISDYDIKELASPDEQQKSDTRTKSKALSSSSSTSKLSSADEPTPPSQIKVMEINDAAPNDLPPQKTFQIQKEGQMLEKSTDKSFNTLQSSSIHQERSQSSDLTTATSISLEPADNLSFMDDEPHESLSEGEVKIKHSSVKTGNLVSLSEGEVPAARFVVSCQSPTENNCLEGKKHATISPISTQNLLQSWSEGEIRNRWVLIPAHGSTSTSTNDSKSQGEVSPLVLGSIRSEGEVTIEDSCQSGKRV